MKTPRILTSLAALATAGILAGCSLVGAVPATSTTPAATATVAAGTAGITVTEAMAANSTADAGDLAWDVASAVIVTLHEDTATASADGVTVDGSTVTITAPGTYLVSGTLAGQVVVDAASEGDVRVVLSGADITSGTGAALTFTAASEAIVVLADGTSNTLVDAKTYVDTTSEDAPNAALFSMADLTIGGDGTLRVTGTSFDGITSKDGLVVEGGTIEVSAADDGIRGKDHLLVSGGTVTVDAGGDALRSDNESAADSGWVALTGGTVTLTAGGDGVVAVTDAIVAGGTVDVTSGGGSGTHLAEDVSAKGLKAGSNVVIGGGTLTIDAADDAVHSDSVISIHGGQVTASSGDDAVHAESSLTIADGTVTVPRSTEGLESEVIEIEGGTIEVTSSDDGLNVSAAGTSATGQGGGGGMETIDGHVTVSGGTLTLHAEGDGFDSNGDATITGGTVVVDGPTSSGNGALDVNGTFTITGGTLIAVGSGGMAEAPDANSAQGWVSAAVTGTQGATIRILSGTTVIAEFAAEKAFGSVVYSSAEVSTGQSYAVEVDGQAVAVTAGEHTGGMGGAGGGARPGRR